MFRKFIFLLFCLQSGLVAASSDVWVRIIQPPQELKDQLQSKAIDYENFLWVNKDDLPNTNLSQSIKTDEYFSPFEMRTGEVRFDLVKSLPQNNLWFADHSSNENAFHLLQFAGPIKAEWLNEISDLGIKLVQPLAPYSYIVWANEASIDKTKTLASVRWSGYFFNAFKLQSHYRDLESTKLKTMALIYKDNKAAVLSHLESLGASSIIVSDINPSFVAMTFIIPGSKYPSILEVPGVLTVQKVNLDGGSRAEMSQQSIVGNYDVNDDVFPGYDTWLTDTGLDGTGVVVGVVDGGIYENHPDLTGNIVDCLGPGPSCGNSTDAHGSHVAGAIAGTGNSGTTDPNGFLRGQGVAPNAKVVEQLYGPLLGNGPGGMDAGGMLSIYKDSAMSGAMLTNNSWGPTGTPQGYDIPTMEIDIISRDADPDEPGNQPVLAVWSVMNGNGDRNSGICSPSSLGSPDEAKNLFAVGSTSLQNNNLSQVTNIFNISANSAHGPACDGRINPHIVAPGCSTDGPASSSGYGTMCGTSMASPVVSGSVSLFWQQYKDNNNIDPSPALVKATFTAIAQNLVGNNDADGSQLGQAPDRKQGWGRIDLDAVINPVNKVWYYDQQTVFTQTSEMWNKELVPDDISQPVRLMLVWTDAAGAGMGGTTKAWVNNLDLSVSTDGNVFKGNVFGVDGFSETGGVADVINNMEGIFIKPEQHNGNNIDISVMAANVSGDAINPYAVPQSPTQDFALVCYNCKESGPVGPDLIFGNDFEYDFDFDLIFEDGFEQ